MAVSLSLFGDPHLEEVAEPRLHTYLPAKMSIGIIAGIGAALIASINSVNASSGEQGKGLLQQSQLANYTSTIYNPFTPLTFRLLQRS